MTRAKLKRLLIECKNRQGGFDDNVFLEMYEAFIEAMKTAERRVCARCDQGFDRRDGGTDYLCASCLAHDHATKKLKETPNDNRE